MNFKLSEKAWMLKQLKKQRVVFRQGKLERGGASMVFPQMHTHRKVCVCALMLP